MARVASQSDYHREGDSGGFPPLSLGWGMDDGGEGGEGRLLGGTGWLAGWLACGVAWRGVVWCGVVYARERHTQWHSTKNVARERPPLENLHASRGRS